ncbi:glutamate racemase [Saccharicrinis aurantiacus]|uniref:glutamate racemase n=1 Tax=Saccharicrinis aurantiacus TaxID=1849719 RepID=UPI00094FDCE6|nr:glutamate racemase [Saccharicrinis aurantiacus]
MNNISGPIAVFDSGYGGLTVLEELRKKLPNNDFIYLGDNARAPYGTRSFDIVYEYTLEAVKELFSMGAHLVILACNTASAKALRTIQQKDLPNIDSNKRVLGVIRPSVEYVAEITKTAKVGVLGTTGTVQSLSYPLELKKQSSNIEVYQEACPMWVPLVENGESNKAGTDYFVKQHIEKLLQLNSDIDTVILGCTHYPMLMDKIKLYTPEHINILSQGSIVANSLVDYLQRHPEIDKRCTRGGSVQYYTTENADKFKQTAGFFLKQDIEVTQINLFQ